MRRRSWNAPWYDGPTEYTLVDPDDEDKKSTVVLETRYLPVPIKLEPRESVNNQGLVRVDLIDGHSIHAADRGGKSDPFVVFHLNGQRVFKSQTKKKTLNPEWNESFTVQVVCVEIIPRGVRLEPDRASEELGCCEDRPREPRAFHSR
ncbi:hypothetical protein NUW54_g14457 [Trametes sanguinea]|uniref:Uncharacterized protein n=1 Tax=Trametes sanguinea TaxID=158606 RepID=A0ACC1MCS2_9APHY|nr:hypothetical protein NUW54_g14457 [Trametes sanguinea]